MTHQFLFEKLFSGWTLNENKIYNEKLGSLRLNLMVNGKLLTK